MHKVFYIPLYSVKVLVSRSGLDAFVVTAAVRVFVVAFVVVLVLFQRVAGGHLVVGSGRLQSVTGRLVMLVDAGGFLSGVLTVHGRVAHLRWRRNRLVQDSVGWGRVSNATATVLVDGGRRGRVSPDAGERLQSF